MAEGPETYDEEVTPSIDPPLIEPPSPATLLGRIFAHRRQERTVVRAPLVRLEDPEPRPAAPASAAPGQDAGTADADPVADRYVTPREPVTDEAEAAAGASPEPPEAEAPSTGTPRIEPPRVETPRVETPRVEAPQVDVPSVEAPQVDVPSVEAPRAETPRVEVPSVETPRIEVPGVEVPRAARAAPEPWPAVAVPPPTPRQEHVATAVATTVPVAQEAPAVRAATRFCRDCDERGPVEPDGLHCHRGHRLSPAHGRRRGGWLRRRSH